MKFSFRARVVGGALLAAACPSRAELRTWTVDAIRQVEAGYVDESLGMVVVETPDGREISLSVSRLSDEDRTYLRERGHRHPAANPPENPGPPEISFCAGEPEFVRTMRPGIRLHRSPAACPGLTWHLHVPRNWKPDSRFPLLVLFSPAGRTEPLLDSLAEAADQSGWLVAGCDGLRSDMGDEARVRGVEDALFADIIAQVPHRADRVCLGGISGGVPRAYGLARAGRRPERIAGILSLGGWLGGTERRTWAYQSGMAVALVSGGRNRGANSWASGDAIALSRSGIRVRQFPFPGGLEPGPSPVLRQALDWLAGFENSAASVGVPAASRANINPNPND